MTSAVLPMHAGQGNRSAPTYGSLSRDEQIAFARKEALKVSAELGGTASQLHEFRQHGDEAAFYRLDLKEAAYFVKVLLPVNRQFEGPWTEPESTKLAASHGLAPSVVPTIYSPGSVLVTHWLPGAEMTEEQGREGLSRRQVAQLLRRIHAVKELRYDLPPSDRLLGAAEQRVRQMREMVISGSAAAAPLPLPVTSSPISIELLGERVSWLKAELYADPGPQAFCHQDAVPRNIMLASEGPLAVDWDWAGYGDPLRDLAMWASDCDMSPDQVNAFLEEYLGGVGSTEQQRRRLQLLVAAVDADYYGFKRVYRTGGEAALRRLERRVLQDNPFLPDLPGVSM